jgi:acyl-CoA hydrolase
MGRSSERSIGIGPQGEDGQCPQFTAVRPARRGAHMHRASIARIDRGSGHAMSGEQRELTMRFLAEPMDVNFGGKVHGGTVMKWIDQAGYAAAVGWSGRYCVTVAVAGIRFLAPVHIGDLVAVTATLVHTGTSSMHFAVEVIARDPMGGDERLCTHCVIVFVALDREAGSPCLVPGWTPSTPHDRRLADYARKVMTLGQDIEQTVRRFREDEAAG